MVAVFLCSFRYYCQSIISYFLAAAATDVYFQHADVGGQLSQYQSLSLSAELSSMRKGHACHAGK